MERESSLEERQRKDAERAAENAARQKRMGVEVPSSSEEEPKEEESKPKAKSRSRSRKS